MKPRHARWRREHRAVEILIILIVTLTIASVACCITVFA